MMIEKCGSIRLPRLPKDVVPTPEQELLAGMVRVNHLFRSALKVAVTLLDSLDEEFSSMYDHSPIHHIEYRLKSMDSISEKLKRQGYEVTIDNIYAHIQDVAGIRVICNYLEDIYYMRKLLTRTDSFEILREADYIKNPKESGYRSLHLILDVPIMISEGTLHLPVSIQREPYLRQHPLLSLYHLLQGFFALVQNNGIVLISNIVVSVIFLLHSMIHFI